MAKSNKYIVLFMLLFICYIVNENKSQNHLNDEITASENSLDCTDILKIKTIYPEERLLEDYPLALETPIEDIKRDFLIEYMYENEDKTKCYTVLKSSKGGYMFYFFIKKDNTYIRIAQMYYKGYVPLAEEYEKISIGNTNALYVNGMYSYTKDFIDAAPIASALITRDFININVYYDFVYDENANCSSFYEYYIVKDVKFDSDLFSYVSDKDKKFIMETFGN